MARFVSRNSAGSVGIQNEVAEHFGTGEKKILKRLIEVKFAKIGLTEYEVERGIKDMVHPGLPEDRIEGGDVSPRSRLGLFDSLQAKAEQGWTDEEHELVLAKLRDPSNGFGTAYIEVETPKRPAPWTGYDKLEDADTIAELTLATGSDVAYVLAYERENRNRPEAVELLEELLIDSPSDEVVIEA